MKKTLCIILVVVLAIGLLGCAKTSPGSKTDPDPVASPDQPSTSPDQPSPASPDQSSPLPIANLPSYDEAVEVTSLATDIPDGDIPDETTTEEPEEPDNSDPTIAVARSGKEMTQLLRPENAPAEDQDVLGFFIEKVWQRNVAVRLEFDHPGGWFQLDENGKVLPTEALTGYTTADIASITRQGMPAKWLKQAGLNWQNSYALVNSDGYATLHHTKGGISADMPIWLLRVTVDGTDYYKIFKQKCGNLISPTVVWSKPPVVNQPDPASITVVKKVTGQNAPANVLFSFRVEVVYDGEIETFEFSMKAGESWSNKFANANLLGIVTVKETYSGGAYWSLVGIVRSGNVWTATNRYDPPGENTEPVTIYVGKVITGATNYPANPVFNFKVTVPFTNGTSEVYEFPLKPNGTWSQTFPDKSQVLLNRIIVEEVRLDSGWFLVSSVRNDNYWTVTNGYSNTPPPKTGAEKPPDSGTANNAGNTGTSRPPSENGNNNNGLNPNPPSASSDNGNSGLGTGTPNSPAEIPNNDGQVHNPSTSPPPRQPDQNGSAGNSNDF